MWVKRVPGDRWCANVRSYLLSQVYVETFQMWGKKKGKKNKGKKKTVIHTPCVHLLATLASSLLLSDQTEIFLKIFTVPLSGEKIGGAP